MRDDRLRWSLFDVQRRQAWSEGRALLTGLETPALDAAIARWWRQEGPRAVADDLKIRLQAGEDLAATLPVESAMVRPAIASAVGGSHGSAAADVAAREILSKGLAALLVQDGAADATMFDSVAEFVHTSADIDSFARAFAGSLAEAERDRWIAALSPIPSDVAACLALDRSFNTKPEMIVAGEKQDRASGAAQYLWKRIWDSERVMLRPRLSVRLAALLALSPTAFFGALERLPSRSLREWILQILHLTQDRDLILEGLRVAPSMYVDGAWNGNVSAALLAKAIVTHAAELSGSVAGELRTTIDTSKLPEIEARLTTLKTNEIPDWLRSAFTVLLRRRDGLWLAASLGAQLVDDSARWRTAEWSPIWTAIEALAGCLAQSDYARESGAWPWREVAAADGVLTARPNAGDYVAFAALVEHEAHGTKPPTSRSGIAWTWYNELLGASDEALCAHVNPHASTPRIIYGIIGTALAAQADVVGAWEAAWNALWPQRNQQRFRLPEFDTLYPSGHLLEVAAAAVLQPSMTAARDLWTKLWRAAARFVLGTSYRHLVPDHVLKALAAVIPAAFGADMAAALTVAGPLLETDSDLTLMAAAMMLLNKASYESVTKSMEAVGCDVSKATAAVRWLAAQLGTEVSESTQQHIRIIEDAAKAASVSAPEADGEKKPT